MSEKNREIHLVARPVGFPKDSDFKLVETSVPKAGPHELIVRNHYVSVDPYLRGRMNDTKSYAPPAKLDEVMRARAVGEVVESNHPDFEPGEFVMGDLGWRDYAPSDGSGLRKIDPELAPISTALGVLGMTGLTAYFGLLSICYPKPGETVVVSGAAGAVGSIVGQIAKIKGCRVIGIAGSDEKVEHIKGDLGFDDGFNYKTTADYQGKLRELCPEGIDVYFDNVGGPISDAVLMNLAVGARISICGQISQYNTTETEKGPRLIRQLIVYRAKMEGFLVFQFADRYEEGLAQMAQWIRNGKLKHRETIIDGLENTPKAFMDMMRGGNTGKQLVRVVAEA